MHTSSLGHTIEWGLKALKAFNFSFYCACLAVYLVSFSFHPFLSVHTFPRWHHSVSTVYCTLYSGCYCFGEMTPSHGSLSSPGQGALTVPNICQIYGHDGHCTLSFPHCLVSLLLFISLTRRTLKHVHTQHSTLSLSCASPNLATE